MKGIGNHENLDDELDPCPFTVGIGSGVRLRLRQKEAGPQSQTRLRGHQRSFKGADEATAEGHEEKVINGQVV